MSWRERTRTSFVYFVSMLAGFSLAYLIVAFIVFPKGVIPRDVKVPNVTGLMYEEAEQRLAQAGFQAERGEQRFNNSAPKGTVLEQSVPPGAREALGGAIALVVSGGQRLSTVPPVTGMTRAEAQRTLEKDGFDVGEVTESQSTSPPGVVIATRPAAGSQASVPATVNIVLSAGEAAKQMPDLMGRDVDAARQTLVQLGVREVQVEFDPMAVGPARLVISQSPVPGATLSRGMTVQLRASGAQTP